MRCRFALVVLALASTLAGTAGHALAQGAPDPAAIEEAKRHMKAGAAFYNDPAGHKCEEALREFRKAFELSGSLNARKGMAICNLELERDGDAIRDYTAYLDGKGSSIDPAEKKQIEADLSALRTAVATIKIRVNRPGVRVTDVRTPSKGFPIRNSYAVDNQELVIGVHPGQHAFTASVEGRPGEAPKESWALEIANGSSTEITFTFVDATKRDAPVPTPEAPPPALPATRPVPASAWVATGVTGALAIAWGVLAVRAKIMNGDYEEVNGKASRASLEAMRSDVKTANLAADIVLGATAAGLATTVILVLTRPTVKPGTRPRAGVLTLSPIAGPTSAGAALGGSF